VNELRDGMKKHSEKINYLQQKSINQQIMKLMHGGTFAVAD
jgi:hypothetical protein